MPGAEVDDPEIEVSSTTIGTLSPGTSSSHPIPDYACEFQINDNAYVRGEIWDGI